MKPLLNTLYVTTQGSWLAREGETVCVSQDKEPKFRVPIHTLSGIVCFGQVSCTPFLMALAAESGVGLSFLTENGQFLARVQGSVSGNVLLRRRQYRASEEGAPLASIARSVVLGKIANCRVVLLRAARERDSSPVKLELEAAALRLARLCEDVQRAMDVDAIRGHEGDAARVYFSVFDHLIMNGKDEFFFHGRNRRPPLDNVNALLSFFYTLLVADITAALECVGLDPAVGFLHRDRPGRPSLSLDLAEELRPVLADRLALSLINRRQISGAGFIKGETGGVVMNDQTRKDILVAWQARKQEEVQHPFLQERLPIGLIPHIQATLFARHLRGDLDAYPCFFWR
jgi:CRISPR-associated protein Cas1